jgi:hypothetical protein
MDLSSSANTEEVTETCNHDDVLIITSNVHKGTMCDVDLFSPLRVLALIMECSMLDTFERFMMQTIVDSGNQVTSVTLLSASQLFTSSPDNATIVKRWISEIQEACLSSNDMVQLYYTLQLLHQIRVRDHMGVSQVVTQSGRAPQDLCPAMQVLHLFLSCPKPTVRFASIQTLEAIASIHPQVVSPFNEDLEDLIGDSNCSISTLMIKPLLNPASHISVDRLLPPISYFFADIADEYKITVVCHPQPLRLTYPTPHRVIISFLSNFICDKGGFQFQKPTPSSHVNKKTVAPSTKPQEGCLPFGKDFCLASLNDGPDPVALFPCFSLSWMQRFFSPFIRFYFSVHPTPTFVRRY